VRARSEARLPAYRQLADALRAQIVSGRLRPGDRLPTEPQLCASSGLSRSTVREALRLLASQHLITTTRGVTGGSFVARPTASALAETLSTGLQMLLSCGPLDGRQVFEVRELIEVPAAGLAAARAVPADVAALRAARFDPDRDGVDAMLAARRRFHTALAAASGNPLIQLIAEPLYAVVGEYALMRAAPGEFWCRVAEEHRAIVEAIASAEPGAARAAAAAHLYHLRTWYTDHAPPAPVPAL
jgi:GntR family transcriptional regulator, transcriptional repressor for pyruvate dehydrogenase complex